MAKEPSAVEAARMRARVEARQLAEALGTNRRRLWEFERGMRETLPNGKGAAEYLEALTRLAA